MTQVKLHFKDVSYKLFILYNGKKYVMFVLINYVYNDVSVVYVG